MIDPTQVSGPVGTRAALPSHLSATGGQTTHPSVLHLPAGWNGFTYWMAHTPYPGGDDGAEDPNIIASNDGVTWVVPSGLVNPIDDQPGSPTANNSDVHLAMNGDTMFLFWRTFIAGDVGAEEKLYYSTSTDGSTWSAKVLFHSSSVSVRRLLSPSLLFEDGRWVMWAVDAVTSPYRVVRLQGGVAPESGWDAPVYVDMGPMQADKDPWHLFVTRTSDGYLALLTDTDAGTTGFNDDILFCVSADGFTFTNSGGPVIPRFQADEHSSLYRATLTPETVAGVAGWRVWYGAYLLGTPRVWNVYRTWITAGDDAPEPPPDPAPPTEGRARARSLIDWIACDLVTGDKIAYLPGLQGTVSRALGAYTADTLSLPAPVAGRLALGGLLDEAVGPDELPGRMIVCIVNDVPAWAGILWKVRGGTSATVELACATPESYLDRRWIGNMTFTQVDRGQIVAEIVQAVNVEGINLLIDAPLLGGEPMDRSYHDDEDATYYQRLQELMDVEDGPEWTIEPEWATERQQRVQLRFTCRARIGAAEPRGPVSTRGAAQATYSVTYDYDKGAGANDVVAYSSGEGAGRPQSVHVRNEAAIASGAPRIEHRWSPSSSIKNIAVLNAHALAELRRIDGGTVSLELDARWDVPPVRLGVDINLGDDLDYDLVGHMHPLGIQGTARMIGWRLDTRAGKFQPVLRRGA